MGKRAILTLLVGTEGRVKQAYNLCVSIYYCFSCRKAWIKLGELSKEDAQKELVRLLYKVAPHLEAYVSEQWKKLAQKM